MRPVLDHRGLAGQRDLTWAALLALEDGRGTSQSHDFKKPVCIVVETTQACFRVYNVQMMRYQQTSQTIKQLIWNTTFCMSLKVHKIYCNLSRHRCSNNRILYWPMLLTHYCDALLYYYFHSFIVWYCAMCFNIVFMLRVSDIEYCPIVFSIVVGFNLRIITLSGFLLSQYSSQQGGTKSFTKLLLYLAQKWNLSSLFFLSYSVIFINCIIKGYSPKVFCQPH